MTINRVSTAAQTAYMLAQIQNAGAALDKTQAQIASTKNATTYAGFGDKTQVLTATLAANARNGA
jgi:putative Ca2+/H+ antiporter (TMEM165/GDT1 family)